MPTPRRAIAGIALVALTGCGETVTKTVIWETGLDPDEAEVDADGDGVFADEDCDDNDPDVYPGAPELCDGKNNDCDAALDEDPVDGSTFYADFDADGYGDPAVSVTGCDRPAGYVTDNTDCDDTTAAANPGAVEICNDGIDNNCNGDEWECVAEGNLSLADAAAALHGAEAGDGAGSAVAGLGDVNGDGFGDLAVGAWRADVRGADSGVVYVVHGPVTGTAGLADVSTARLEGVLEGQNAGSALAPAGDVDGDGYADLLAASFHADGGGNDSGEAYLVFGPMTGDLLMSDADLRMVGEVAYDLAGTSVALGGDVDGDGVVDLLVGASSYGEGGYQARGAAYVVSTAEFGTLDLRDATARVEGESRYDRLGTAVAAAGDVNGDGVGDFAISGYTWSANDNTGAAFVVHGPVSGRLDAADAAATLVGEAEGAQAGIAMSAGDVDGDGLGDLAISATQLGAEGAGEGAVYVVYDLDEDGTRSLAEAGGIVVGAASSDAAGAALSADGDMNQDGVADLWVGVPGGDRGAEGAGAAALFYGPLAGTVAAGDGRFQVFGAAASEAAGTALSMVSDVDGDGVVDLVIGAPGADVAAADAGAAYVVLGVGG